MLASSTSIPIIFTFPVAASARKNGISWRQGIHQDPQTLITAGPVIDSKSTFELPSKQVSVVPEVLLSSVEIEEHEITLPFPTLFGIVLPQDVKSIIEIRSAEITFIENPHLFLIAP
jgi:hypothetical protein